MTFADHFSEQSSLYASARPRYPDAVYAFVAQQAPARDHAWDCASGNGQAAEGLARHLERFYTEARRVLKPGGVIAVWGYDWMRTAQGFDALFTQGVLGKLKPYWPAQNRLLWGGYRTVAFPFERLEAPPFEMRLTWSFEQFMQYVLTWTGTRKYLESHGARALDADWEALRREWGDGLQREFVVPLHFLCGRHGQR